MNWVQGIYESHRLKEGTVDICGVVLYTDAHANIKKVLSLQRNLIFKAQYIVYLFGLNTQHIVSLSLSCVVGLLDKIYWSALNDISGPLWAIIAVKPSEGRYEYPKFPPGTLGYMVPIWKEPRENKELIEEFELESTEELPLFICFSHDSDGNILKNSLSIDDSTVDNAYNSLKNHISLITKAVTGIAAENRSNPLGVYSAVSLAVDSFKQWELIKKGINYFTWLKKFKI
jgi:hypothetical protein